MPTALIYSEGQGRTEELQRVFLNLKDWEIYTHEQMGVPDRISPPWVNSTEIHFLIYSKPLDKYSIDELKKISQQLPFVDMIYYHGFLYDQQYQVLAKFEINACIIGIHRQRYLAELLPRLWEKHWKKIPARLLPSKTKTGSLLAKNLIRYIENHTLDHCNIKELAVHTGISESHFRAEFKRQYKKNFRDFKQELFTHFEKILLVDKKIRPNNVYKLLNYANLANFSRSFKSRHGESWREYNGGDTEISH